MKLNIALFLKTFVFKYSHSLKCKSSILCLVAVVILWNESSRSDCSKEYRAALRSPAKCWQIPKISQEMSLQCWGIDFPWLTTVCRSFKADCISIVLFMCLQQKISSIYNSTNGRMNNVFALFCLLDFCSSINSLMKHTVLSSAISCAIALLIFVDKDIPPTALT